MHSGDCGLAANGGDSSFITADTQYLYRYEPTGILIWSTPLPYKSAGAFQCRSIKIGANGQVTVLSGSRVGKSGSYGPIATFNSTTGAVIGANLYPGGTDQYNTYGVSNSGCLVDKWP